MKLTTTVSNVIMKQPSCNFNQGINYNWYTQYLTLASWRSQLIQLLGYGQQHKELFFLLQYKIQIIIINILQCIHLRSFFQCFLQLVQCIRELAINSFTREQVYININISTRMKVKDYYLIEEIGSGSFATVYKAIDSSKPPKTFAIKSMRDIPQNEKNAIMKEISILTDIQKRQIRGVVNYITQFQEKNKWYIVFEYCGKGDVEKFLKQQGRLPESFCKSFASSIISPLSQLHQKQKIAHRDLKLSNILINDDYNFKIADFGMAKAQNNDGIMESYCGTPYAMAPEVLRREVYDTKCDTWSLGIMIYQLVYGRLPFDGRKNGGGIYGLTEAVLREEPVYPSSVQVSAQCIDFIKKCLKKNPKERPTMRQLSQHPWLSIGTSSSIPRAFLKQKFQGNGPSQDQLIQAETIKRAKQVLNQSVSQHLSQLFKNYKLIAREIVNYLKIFDKYYGGKNHVKQVIIMMIAKIMREMVSKKITIDIDKEMSFVVKLNRIQSFRSHIRNIESLLNQELKTIEVRTQNINFEREIIGFVIEQGQACLSFNQNYPDKISLLQYLSKLPIKLPGNSSINIAWGFNEEGASMQLSFNKHIKQMSEEIVYKYIDQPINKEEGEKNWIIQHHFEKQKGSGTVIQMGEFISRVIDINAPTLSD